ncbi:hypothetical protein M9H77_23520 [Catharanthus roseus]|uniref:Uncharacterized protein n=1 Tax=Catharanthus roseus TaxID=4058 RepID=A0ACC0AT53_CATRO|nr:hypothetical protein M9H77_23520 [Catharanthus roseus]
MARGKKSVNSRSNKNGRGASKGASFAKTFLSAKGKFSANVPVSLQHNAPTKRVAFDLGNQTIVNESQTNLRDEINHVGADISALNLPFPAPFTLPVMLSLHLLQLQLLLHEIRAKHLCGLKEKRPYPDWTKVPKEISDIYVSGRRSIYGNCHYKEEVKKEMEQLAKETQEGEQPPTINYANIWLRVSPPKKRKMVYGMESLSKNFLDYSTNKVWRSQYKSSWSVHGRSQDTKEVNERLLAKVASLTKEVKELIGLDSSENDD